MKKLSIILTLLVIFAFIICNFNFYKVEAANQSYVALGDSIPAGYGLNTTSERYTNILANKIGMSLRNLAVSGHKTTDLLKVIKNQTSLSYIKNADLITISIGGNDMINSLESILNALGGNDEIFTECENNLKQITNYLKANTKKDCIIIYQNIANCYKYTMYGIFVTNAINRLNGLISNQCDGNKFYFCDIATSLEKSGDNFFATQGGDYALDPHPTAKGHKIIANEMYNKYSSIISQRPTETTTNQNIETTQTIQTTTIQTTYETTSKNIETTQTIQTTTIQTTYETTSKNIETTIPTIETTNYVETSAFQQTTVPIIETTNNIETTNQTSSTTTETTEIVETSKILETSSSITETTTFFETTIIETTTIPETTTIETTIFEQTTNETTIVETIEETTIVTEKETTQKEIETENSVTTQKTINETSNTTKEETMVIYTESSETMNNNKKNNNVIIYIILAVLIGGGSFVVVFIFKKQKEQ